MAALVIAARKSFRPFLASWAIDDSMWTSDPALALPYSTVEEAAADIERNQPGWAAEMAREGMALVVVRFADARDVPEAEQQTWLATNGTVLP